ncbi:hypothetical protein K6959_18030 [Bacillus aquiflavi]|uniref:hypothetical protein n=1 Tax=Bacillus aquiflavi TaxID=2672567 RepID=UPI001CA9AB5D|nr:hypothetical protein [Bacillus aquiflavi]UAC48372.1 hypothetical protein K6959_18030 [Bacillus aquiflavi]
MKSSKYLRLSIISSILIIIFQAFQLNIINIVTPFLMPIIWRVIFGLYIVVTIITVYHLLKHKDWQPIFIQIVTILLIFYFPFTETAVQINFKMNKSAREEVVRMVEDGTLEPNVSHNSDLISLPKKYARLSKGGGDILIKGEGNRYFILFFAFRGVVDNSSVFCLFIS